MHDFTYVRAASVADAVRRLRADADAKLIAGGQSLLGAMKLGLAAPPALIDLAGIAGLDGIACDGRVLTIGAAATHAAVAASPVVRQHLPALADLAHLIGDPAVRSRGTLGGSLAHADPAACYPAAMLALGASIETDRRRIAADDFFTGLYETALARDELVVAVHVPLPRRAAWRKLRQPASRFALVGVFVADTAAGPRIAVTGAASCVFRVPAGEAALASAWSPDALRGLVVPADALNGDLHASATYRAHLIPVLATRAVAATLNQGVPQGAAEDEAFRSR